MDIAGTSAVVLGDLNKYSIAVVDRIVSLRRVGQTRFGGRTDEDPALTHFPGSKQL